MADDKRNRPEQPQSDNRPNRERSKERRSGGASIESPEGSRKRRESEDEPQE